MECLFKPLTNVIKSVNLGAMSPCSNFSSRYTACVSRWFNLNQIRQALLISNKNKTINERNEMSSLIHTKCENVVDIYNEMLYNIPKITGKYNDNINNN